MILNSFTSKLHSSFPQYLFIVCLLFLALVFKSERAIAKENITNKIEKGTILHVCGEAKVDWYPFEVEKEVEGKRILVGYTIDVLEELLSRYGLKYDIELRPWQRCMDELEKNERQIATATSLSAERQKKFFMTQHIYSVTPAYFYMKEKYPNGLNVETADQLLSLGRVCGRLNYHS